MSAAYTPRHYVLADTDRMSEEKICTFESLKQQSDSQVRMMELLVLTQCGDAQRELTELCGLHGPAAAPQHSAEVQIQQSVPPLDSAEDLLLPRDCIIIGRRVLTAAGSHTGRVTYFLSFRKVSHCDSTPLPGKEHISKTESKVCPVGHQRF